VIITSDKQLRQYQQAAKISMEILWQLHQKTKNGVTPLEIDMLADELCQRYGVKPNFRGVGGTSNEYQYATCISVNDTVVHGIPQNVPLKAGDLVKVDFGLEYQGLNTDHCFTVGIGPVSSKDKNLMETGRAAVLKAAKQAIAGKYTGDLGDIMESTAHSQGYMVTEQYVGHGIGTTLHEEPQLPAWGDPGTGDVLREGMVLCVEAQVIAGDSEVYTAKDGWSVKTVDGSKSVMFECMVVVGKNKPEFLTTNLDWPLIV
jgi:methionyl aminopeptidase